jgi:hypothetical protein
VLAHFGHSKVRKSKPGLSGSMSRNTIISPHFAQRGLLITFTNTAYPHRQLHHWTRFALIPCCERDGVWKSAGQQSRNSRPASRFGLTYARNKPLEADATTVRTHVNNRQKAAVDRHGNQAWFEFPSWRILASKPAETHRGLAF